MSIPKSLLESVRIRAKYACEFCTVREIDAGGNLTIDHFQPTSKGGDDSFENLIYCCHNCNFYKHQYFPENAGELSLWNPRLTPFSSHFLELEDGSLKALSEIGSFTIKMIRLNRPQLIAYRRERKRIKEERELIEEIRRNSDLITSLSLNLKKLYRDEKELHEIQMKLIQIFLSQNE